MNARDQSKLIKVGFIIIRKEFSQSNLGLHRIKAKGSGGHEWYTFEGGFKTKVALEKRMKELLENSTIVED